MKELIAAHLNISSASIVKVTELYKVWCVVVEGRRPRFVSKAKVLEELVPQSVKIRCQTGSEWHTTERRGAMVTVNGQPIYQALKPISQDWELVGNKGKHGKWCYAEYELPVGAKVEFSATANSREKIVHRFVVGQINPQEIDFEGYDYGSRYGGFIVAI